MYPTFDINDQLAVEKVSKLSRSPLRGEVVVFTPPPRMQALSGRDSTDAVIKRVVAVAGDTVEVQQRNLFVNGKQLNEMYINEAPAYTLEKLTVPADNVFVLGDNRNKSFDSHFWGFLPIKNIIGHATFIYWPPTHFGAVPEGQETFQSLSQVFPS
jgi:signal peptidase I